MAIAKAAVAVVAVVGLATATGIALVSSNPVPMPASEALFEDSDFSSEYGSDSDEKYGRTYSKFMVGVKGKTGSSIDLNKWWEWSFNNRFPKDKTTLKDKFSTVDKATEGDKSLKNICKAAYKEKLKTASGNENIVTTLESKDEAKFLESNIWLFCSTAKEKVKTIKDVYQESETKINPYNGQQAGNGEKYGKKWETKLVSATDNKWFWDKKQEELLDAKADLSANPTSKFKLLQDKLKKGQDIKDTDTVRKVCEAAYGEAAPTDNGTTTGAYVKTEVFKFCSLSGTATTN